MNIKSRAELLAHIGHIRRAAEIGVLNGQFSKRISEIMRPDEFYLIDTWGSHLPTFADYRDYTKERWERMRDRVSRWAAPLGYKVLQKRSMDAVHLFPDGFFDFVYIDADHDRAREDIVAWLPKVKKGGIIAGHDYVWNPENNRDPVGMAVREIFGKDFDHTHESLQSWWHIVK